MSLPSTRLDGGVALVTGAASGIGKETAFALAEAGVAAIVLADLRQPDESTIKQCQSYSHDPNFQIVAVEADVSNEASVAEMVQTVVGRFGRIDYCVHAAGVPNVTWVKTAEVEAEIFDRILATNARGTMLVVRDVSKAMAQQEPRTYRSSRHGTERSLGRGVIVVVAALAGLIAAPTMLPYSVSKYATVGICKTAAVDNIDNYIRVNSVCPGWIDTPMVQNVIQETPALDPMIAAMMPHRRLGLPEEVADSIVFLCSPAASFINGDSVLIDAGQSLTAVRSR
ncbi:hypothetical protein BDW62DRAFT_216451 [Aspergillus aurantiobrunneus]